MIDGRTLATLTAPAFPGGVGASVAIAAVVALVATPRRGAAPATG
jgi:hypothetical protein